MTQVMLEVLRKAFTSFLEAAVVFVPRLLALVVIVVVGGVISWIVARALRFLLRWLGVGRYFERVGATQVLGKVDLPSPETMLSHLVFWLLWLAFLVTGLSALGFGATEELVSRLVLLVPQIVVAFLIMGLGFLIANFVSRATLLAAFNANVRAALLLSRVVWFFIVILAVAMALEQLPLAKTVVLSAFTIAFGAVMLGLAIAFGIGGRDLAGRLLERHFPEPSDEREDEIGHV